MKTLKYLLIVLILSSCGAPYHLRQAKRHKEIAIAKGASVAPDTVWVNKTVNFEIPGSGLLTSGPIVPVIDTKSFDDTMSLNDSLVIEEHGLEEAISEGSVVDKEKAIGDVSKLRAQIKDLKSRIAKGFSKDSTYYYEPDSLTKISVEIKGGLLNRINYIREPQVIVKQMKLPVWINEVIKSGFTGWQLIGAGIFSFVLAFLLGYLVRSLR